MKSAIHVMVLLSKIFSIVLAVFYLIMVITNFVQAGQNSGAEAIGYVSSAISYIFTLSFAIAAIVVSYTKADLVEKEVASQGDCIVCIVFGALGCVFLLVAGILGLVDRNRRQQA